MRAYAKLGYKMKRWGTQGWSVSDTFGSTVFEGQGNKGEVMAAYLKELEAAGKVKFTKDKGWVKT